MKVTRTFKRYQVKVAVLSEDMTPDVLYESEVIAPSISKADVRSMARDAIGHDVPRGALVKILEVGEVKYQCDLSAFLSIAEVVD